MKITFIIPHADLSGGIRVIAIYAERLKKRGHDVFVVSAPKPRPTLKQQAKSVLKQKGWIPYNNDEPSHFDNSIVPLKVLKRYCPIVDADVPDADVVIATWWETAEWVAKLSKSKGAKVYFIQHYEVFDYLPKQRVEATWSLPMHKIVVAEWLAEIAAKKYKDNNVSYVANGIDTNQFFAIPRGKQTVPTVGLMYAEELWKGCDISLKAFELAKKMVPDLHLVTFGRCSEVETLPLPSGSEHYLQPSQSLLQETYSRCDVWLFGSRFEGFGLPILEAMACRTPVIATPAGAAPELLEQGGGILVKPEDPADMATAIQTICQLSEADWKMMSDRAHGTAIGYTWEDATDRFEAGLHTAIDRQKRGDFSYSKTEITSKR
ncbi:glycosyltransferase family 4 protein [Leptolyngbyaceae cyanobacterium UHCC 1019]